MAERSTIVVTGGAGFIGSELVRQLAARGERVLIVDNLINGRRENVADVLSRDVTLRVADVRDTAALMPDLRDARAVYHLACLGVRHSVHSPHENHDVNATATLQLLAAARRSDVPRFVYVSSSEVYGGIQATPIRGDRPPGRRAATAGGISEDHPAFPCPVYGGSKLAGESYARAYFRTYGYPTVVIRPFNTYGPRSHHEGDSGEVIPKFLLRCLAGRPMVVFGDGSQSRDFTYVSDTAHGILLAGEHPSAVGETINIGTGTDVTIADLARRVAVEAGRPDAVIEYDQPRPGDVYSLIADVSRARTLLGFEPRVSMSEGLQRLLQWYRAQRQTPEELLEQEIVRNWTAPRTRCEQDRRRHSRRTTLARRAGRRGCAPRDPLGLGHAGPGGGGLRARVRRRGRRASRLRRVQLHDGSSSRAARPWRRSWRRGDHREPFVHCHGERGALLPCDAGVRGCHAGHPQHRPLARRAGDLGPHQSHPRRPPARDAVRSRGGAGDRPAPRSARGRGRRLRDWQ
jgi:UDP-glucose 4-epimerase